MSSPVSDAAARSQVGCGCLLQGSSAYQAATSSPPSSRVVLSATPLLHRISNESRPELRACNMTVWPGMPPLLLLSSGGWLPPAPRAATINSACRSRLVAPAAPTRTATPGSSGSQAGEAHHLDALGHAASGAIGGRHLDRNVKTLTQPQQSFLIAHRAPSIKSHVFSLRSDIPVYKDEGCVLFADRHGSFAIFKARISCPGYRRIDPFM